MKPVVNVITGNTHCAHNHATIKSATHCRRLKLRERGEGSSADEQIKLQAFALDERGRYVKVSGNLVAA